MKRNLKARYVRGNLVLEEPLPLSDGTQVEITLRSTKGSSVRESPEADEGSLDAVDLDQRIQQALYSAGLVTEIKPPVKRPRERRPPINIKGKPLSETIIEDRR